MLHAGCKNNPDLLAPPPNLANVKTRMLDTDAKAFIDLNTGEVTVDPEFLSTLSEDSAVAMLYHEIAHTQKNSCARYCDGKPQGCERCADNRLGACMALSGYDSERTKRALVGMNLDRPTLLVDTMAGFEFANSRLTKAVPSTGNPSSGQRQLPAPIVPVEAKDSPFQPGLISSELPKLPLPKPPVTNAPSEKPTETVPAPEKEPTTVYADDCSYDFNWVVGVAAGAFSLAIIATQWTFQK